MSSVSGTSSDSTYADLGLATKQVTAASSSQTLGQADFLKLMTTQLQYQDPMKPMDNSEFVSQMAQFSTVSGIQDLQTSFSSLASSLQSSQALQGASLVGHAVLVPATSGYLGDDTALSGAVDVKSSGTVSVQITDASGQVVRHLDLGTQPAGMAQFNWDGTSDEGVALPSGTYKITAQVAGSGSQQALDTYAVGIVNSVAVDGNTLTLDLKGMDSVPFSKVQQII